MSKENKTETLFQDDIEYSVKTPDRLYKYILDNKNVVYLNIAQLRFMRSEYWEEKQEQKYLSKCIIGFDKNGLKRCRKDCVKCEWYKSPRSNSGIVSLDDLDYELEEYQEDNEPIDFFKNPKIHSLLHIFINEISNCFLLSSKLFLLAHIHYFLLYYQNFFYISSSNIINIKIQI